MAAKRNILDVYRDFRKKDPSVCYAFGDAEFFTFYMTDAHRVHNALPDLRIEHERCDILRIHKLAFFPTAARLKAGGVRVAMVARTKAQNGGYTYRIDGYSFDEEDSSEGIQNTRRR